MKPAMPDSIELLEVKKLIPYARNSRTHNPDQVRQIAASIKEFGFTNPVLISETNDIIAGHGRTMAAELLGIDKVPCLRLGYLTPAQRKAYVIADNKLALNAGWDAELLGLEIGELREEDYDIDLLGFTEEELAALVVEELPEGLTDEDEVPDVPEEPISKEGDVWILGRHRLMCGDSTSIDAVERLMDGKKADMVFTDPPYGIAHSGKGITANCTGNDFGQIMGDDDVTVAIDAFRLCSSLWPEARMIFWGANYYPSTLPDGYGWLVWDKEREGDTFSGAELAFVNGGVRVDVFRHMWHGMVKASEHGQKRVHPTQKPMALAEWCFDRYGNPETVIDLFGGSGSTLIACEKTARDCRMMELDPKYVDVIIRRWQDFTGQAAIHEETGKTFDEMSNG